MLSRKSWSKSLLLAGLLPLRDVYAQEYLLGVGIGDVTGPVVETNMMGYADLSQTDTGLHMRQFSRAYIVATPGTNSAKDRILFINSDLQSGDTAIRRGILEQLNRLYPGTVLAVKRAHESLAPGTLSLGNVTVLDTNLNRSPYAYEANPASERARYQYDQDKDLHLLKFTDNSGTARGFLSFFAVHGTSLYQNNTLVSTDNKGMAAYLYEADVQPNVAPGKNTFVAGFVQANVGDTTPNTLGAFCESPGKAWDGQPCEYQKSTCGNVTQGCRGRGPGFRISDFESNRIIGENQYLGAKKLMTGNSLAPVKGAVRSLHTYVNIPNTLGAFCESPGKPWDGQPCEYQKSTCGNVTQGCRGRGPGFRISDFESNRIIGENQYSGAKKLMTGNSLTSVKGAVRSLHTYVNMSSYSFPLPNGTAVHTCPPAMGYSFAGGTSDGPGAFDFTQGQTADGTQNPFWEVVKGIITAPPNAEQKRCHYPKPILLNTGYTKFPYAWQPDIVDIQMMRVGQFVVLVVPGEFTTMAGRRIRESVRAKLISSGIIGDDAYVVLAGPANTYSHYVTTREEYGVQRYEGASTIYGPFTLEAYQNLYTGLVSYLADGASSSPPTGPIPEDLTKKAISLQTGVVFDAAPIGKSFGSVLTDVTTSSAYKRGQKVTATFQAANPRNNLRLEGTFLTIERLTSSTWATYRTDSHPSTKFRWTRTNTVLGYSTVEVEWTVESNAPDGTYRITYYGDSKPLIGSISSFTGMSSNFTISG
ncbi:unnamed protein product [Rhizoctonia solani]|uniref:Neutral ceramidase n=1 Tax=Rhizoctonia solani TaxID=456999 RepID=A0A8H2XQA7_9AGAM|nr:unnamed protein product [Rhizoctonia solani]